MEYRIRAHHGMCFFFFQGKGYSSGFTQNMWEMKKKLEQDPYVVLLCGADDVCTRCPNNQAGVCISDDKAADYDRQVLAVCGLRAGTRIRWKAFEALVRERILRAGRRTQICGGCQWNELCF